MALLGEELPSLPDFSEFSCDVCENSAQYILLGNNDGVSLCDQCYSLAVSADAKVLLPRTDTSYRICDICKQYLNGRCAWGIGQYFDVCEPCLPQIGDVFTNNKEDLITNDREYLYVYKTPDPDTYEVPEQLKSRVLPVDNYVDVLSCLVRPPTMNANLAEWVLISVFEPVTLCDVSCALAVRCIKGHHQIASLVSDDHGRVAMNIVYNNVQDFLAEESVFKSQCLSGEELRNAKEELKQQPHDIELLLKATTSFAVYVRISKNLCLNYG